MSQSRIKYPSSLFRSCIELSPIERQHNPSQPYPAAVLQSTDCWEIVLSASMGHNHWGWPWAQEEWKCHSQTISPSASSLSFVNGSYQQNRWWLKEPSDNSSISMPNAFVEFASFPSSHFAVISPVSQTVVTCGEVGKSKGISRAPENLRW